jgi:drug/metabolite transporter (DMT)-like permease
LTGLFDAGGNAFYMLAKQFTRIDVAVVLSSLYPAITVVLSRIFLKEKISRFQWLGVGLCFAAVVLISV